MKTQDLDYSLPAELIAQQPAIVRSESRLLVLERSSGRLADRRFGEIGEYLRPADCLVLNDTKVLPARFFARRGTGGKLEGLFLAEKNSGIWEVMLKGGGKLRVSEEIYLRNKACEDFCAVKVLEKQNAGHFRLKVDSAASCEEILEAIGFAPLPPYIRRDNDITRARIDKIRYQTVYAKENGAVAAPTAGLHFTTELLEKLTTGGIKFAYITLHVGEGTFKPVTTENIEEHKIHREQFGINEQAAETINETKQKGGRIIAVGTTSVRTLESAVEAGLVKAKKGDTELFIKPGYEFRIVDAMVTNFHLPKSTLLALVGAFAGLDKIFTAYNHAIEQRYRFFSYGDAMLII